jgi:hypothetical protein
MNKIVSKFYNHFYNIVQNLNNYYFAKVIIYLNPLIASLCA